MSSKIVPRPPLQTRQWPPRSLGGQLTLWYAFSTFILILMGAFFLYFALLQAFGREADEFLAENIRIVEAGLNAGPEGIGVLRSKIAIELPVRNYAPVYIRVVDPDGGVLMQTLQMESFPMEAFPEPRVEGWEQGGINFSASGQKPCRLQSALIRTASSGDYTVYLACDLSHQADIVRDLRRFLLAVVSISFLLCGIIGHGIARRGMSRVKRIAETARKVRFPTLHERISTEGLPTELAQLAETFNEMLFRLDDSFRRLSQFSADLAHELRTPITNMRGEVEVALARGRSESEYRDVLGSTLEECERLSNMVDRLLLISRAEAGGADGKLAMETLDVSRELSVVREFFEAEASELGSVLKSDDGGSMFIKANRELFQCAISNLVANSLAHTPEGGMIELKASRAGDRTRISVSDTGTGIEAEHLPHIFDRFYRADPSRSTKRGGMGLGLSIVRAIAKIHDAEVEVESEAGKGTTVTIAFLDAEGQATSRT